MIDKKSILINYQNNISNILSKERYNFILWLPIIFILGCIFRFDFTENFNINILNKLFTLIFLFSIIISIFTKNIYIRFLSIISIFIALGFIRTNYVINKFNFPTIKEPLGLVKIFGTIEKENININKRGLINKDLIVSVEKIEPFYKNAIFKSKIELPKKLQLRLSDSEQAIHLNTAVISCYLFPIESKRLSSSFNEQRYYYFKEIGGLGYRCEVISNDESNKKLTIKQRIDILRFNIAQRVIAVREDSKSTGIMAILLTGQKNLADKQAVENMNFSGLAHLLSISGLHMMILIGLVMFLVKWILLRSKTFALNHDIFKISAVVSLVVNFLYLIISGANISAVRAYIMSVILMTSVIIGRFGTGLRSVMFTMFLLVFLKPYIIYTAGFQLSFMAVIIIISIMNDYSSKNFSFEFHKTKIMKFFDSIKLSFIISFAVECATTPFSIYNFNNYSFYNVLINSFITPLMTLFILPLCIISLFLMPFHLEFLPLLPASYATDFVLWVSNFLVSLPYSVMFIRSPNNFSLFFMIFGLLWFSLWKSSWRKFGILFYIIGIIILFFQKTPEVIVDNRDKMVLFFYKDFYVLNPNKYEIQAIIRKFGRNNFFDKMDLNNCKNGKKCVKIDKDTGCFHKDKKYICINEYDSKYYIKEKAGKWRILFL